MTHPDAVTTFRRYLDALNRRDVEAMLAETDPDVEFHTPRGTTIRGHAALRAAVEEPGNVELTIEPQRWFATATTVVGFGLVRYTWAGTGEPAGEEEQAVVAVAGDRGLRSIPPYGDRDAALADSGLTADDEVEPPRVS